jgi:hypothetical protein
MNWGNFSCPAPDLSVLLSFSEHILLLDSTCSPPRVMWHHFMLDRNGWQKVRDDYNLTRFASSLTIAALPYDPTYIHRARVGHQRWH